MRRVFTRRRHAEASARRWLRISAWVGLPTTLLIYLWEVSATNALPVVGLAALTAVGLAYSSSVLKVRDLTGEWQFY